MEEKTYYQGKKEGAILDVLLLLTKKAEGWTAEEAASELALKEPSARNYLELLCNRNLAEKQGTRYVVGREAALLWSRRIALLNNKKNNADKELQELGV